MSNLSTITVQQFAWSPDGRTIAYATEDEAEKKTGPERFNDSFEVGNDDFLIQSQALPTHAWLVPADGGEARRITSGSWSLPINHPPIGAGDPRGPTAASLETFASQAQLMAAKGWVVFQPNYRGSDQIGNVYQRAIVSDAGAGPGRDVMAGVEALKRRGFVDTARIAVSGWSYGGYMTTWLLGNYQGWRVAVAGAAVTDWVDQ